MLKKSAEEKDKGLGSKHDLTSSLTNRLKIRKNFALSSKLVTYSTKAGQIKENGPRSGSVMGNRKVTIL